MDWQVPRAALMADSAALALRVFLSVKAHRAKQFSIAAQGRDCDICGEAKNNLILDTYKDVLQRERKPVVPLELKITNEIPIGKGCDRQRPRAWQGSR